MQPKCDLCGESIPTPKPRAAWIDAAAKECSDRVLVGAGAKTFAEIIERYAREATETRSPVPAIVAPQDEQPQQRMG